MERKASVTWDDIAGWAVDHPYISFAAVVFLVVGLLTSLVDQFPRFEPVARVIGYIAILVGGLVLFIWIIPALYEAITAHSRLENTAIVICHLAGADTVVPVARD